MLVIHFKLEDTVVVNPDSPDAIEVKLLRVRGDTVKIGFKAPPHIKIHREKVLEAIRRGAGK